MIRVILFYNLAEIYENVLYDIFREDFVDDHPEFEGQPVKFRWHPIEYGKPEAFFHLTCQDYSKTEEERYLVILEPRPSYYLLITAFYLQYDHALRKQRKHYEQYK